METHTVILILAAIVVGILYFARRSARQKREARKQK